MMAEGIIDTSWRRFLVSVLGRFDVDRCEAWSTRLRLGPSTEVLRRAAAALCGDAAEDEPVAPDGQFLDMVAALPQVLMERVLEFLPSPRLLSIRGAAQALELISCAATGNSGPPRGPPLGTGRGFWIAARHARAALRDVCILRAVSGPNAGTRDDQVQLILDSFSQGSALRSFDTQSQLLMAYDLQFGPRAGVHARRRRHRRIRDE